MYEDREDFIVSNIHMALKNNNTALLIITLTVCREEYNNVHITSRDINVLTRSSDLRLYLQSDPLVVF